MGTPRKSSNTSANDSKKPRSASASPPENADASHLRVSLRQPISTSDALKTNESDFFMRHDDSFRYKYLISSSALKGRVGNHGYKRVEKVVV